MYRAVGEHLPVRPSLPVTHAAPSFLPCCAPDSTSTRAAFLTACARVFCPSPTGTPTCILSFLAPPFCRPAQSPPRRVPPPCAPHPPITSRPHSCTTICTTTLLLRIMRHYTCCFAAARRLATTGLLLVVSLSYPALQLGSISLIFLDIFSHWFQMYASLAGGAATHKVRAGPDMGLARGGPGERPGGCAAGCGPSGAAAAWWSQPRLRGWHACRWPPWPGARGDGGVGQGMAHVAEAGGPGALGTSAAAGVRPLFSSSSFQKRIRKDQISVASDRLLLHGYCAVQHGGRAGGNGSCWGRPAVRPA